ncbi:hypothetical protein BDZ97DRAFT_1911462 [Flammula alnicola]|nr:hypothetical protein BDZ97DRAFT_1911462 [Flammula alnicola]
MSIMRNMADLLECSTADDATTVKGLKGKDRELDAGDLGLRSVDRYGDSPVISAIINEFKAMKEELRHTQQWSREEFQRDKEQGTKARAEMDEMRQRHRDEVERLKDSIQLMEKEREKRKVMDEETRMPALEMLELRRRISSLESRSRLDGFTSDVQGSIPRLPQ